MTDELRAALEHVIERVVKRKGVDRYAAILEGEHVDAIRAQLTAQCGSAESGAGTAPQIKDDFCPSCGTCLGSDYE